MGVKVNELMDTMMAEKQALKEKIASLEVVRVPHHQYMAHGYPLPPVPFTNTFPLQEQLQEEANCRTTPNEPERAPDPAKDAIPVKNTPAKVRYIRVPGSYSLTLRHYIRVTCKRIIHLTDKGY